MWAGKKRFNLFSTPAYFASLLLKESMWGFQDIFSFSWSPRKLKFFTLSKGVPLISKSGITPSILLFMAWKITYLVFPIFRDNLLTANQSYTLASSLFMLIRETDGIRIVLLRVVSSAYKIKLKYSVQLGMSFIYIRNNKGPRIEPCGTPVDNEFRKSLVVCMTPRHYLNQW